MSTRGTPALLTLRRVLLDLVFPPRCISCHHPGEWFCSECRSHVHHIAPPICRRCGQPLSDGTCAHCRRMPLHLDGLRAVAFFEDPLRQIIHRFKYESRPELGRSLACLLDEYLIENPLPVDVIVPVPLHPQRERARGFNQSLILARELASRKNLPLWYNVIERCRLTQPQVDLNLPARFENVRGAFQVVGDVQERRILLVDDVCTTGATLDACGLALKESGACSVWGLALARGR